MSDSAARHDHVLDRVGVGGQLAGRMVVEDALVPLDPPLLERGAADDERHRQLLDVGAGERVEHAEGAHPVGQAEGAGAAQAGVGVGGVARDPLVGHPHAPDHPALVDGAQERPGVVAGHGEQVLGAEVRQAPA